MGKKVKTGKARKDKYYKLAKETGYRSRAAFKLIQLNRKFNFLQTSRVVLDLCAAPGGWLQVAAQNTPLASIIVGVDLVPIVNIRRVTTIQGDITTDKCIKSLKKVFQQWNVDCVLHDGAPNVGQNWMHDAYQQASLTLSAVKLCTVFLKKGGWFITKIFRSKDYNSLQWVLQQLFKNVHTTKPHASRAESSEVYVVCQNYLAPDKIDPKFLDIRHVFKDIDQDRTQLPQLDLRRPNVKTKSVEGYPEGETILCHTMTATEFMTCSNHLEKLADITKIEFTDDDKDIASNPLTTEEIRSLCEDIKVINKRDIKIILKWRKSYLKQQSDKKPPKEDDKEVDSDNSEVEEAALDQQIESIKQQQRLDKKRKLKKVKEEKGKLKSKLAKSRAAAAESGEIPEDMELFSLKNIKSSTDLDTVVHGDLQILDGDYDDKEEKPSIRARPADPIIDRDAHEYMEQTDSEESDDNDDADYMAEDDVELETQQSSAVDSENPLVTHLEDNQSRSARLFNEWFSKESFAGIEDERDEDLEIDTMVKDYKRRGGIIQDSPPKKKTKKKPNETAEDSDDDPGVNEDTLQDMDFYDKKNFETKQATKEDGDSTDTEDEDADGIDHESALQAARLMAGANGVNVAQDDQSEAAEIKTTVTKNKKDKKKKNKTKTEKANGFEIVPVTQTPLPTHLDEVGLALGAAIATSRKRRREIIENAYNRYMFDDNHLPSWFVKEEQNHRARPLPISKAEVQEYKERQKEIDARPIKKIAEAKARKKRRLTIRLKKARKRAEGIDDTQDVSEKEKWSQIKQIYKKAGLLNKNKKDVTYVVAKKGGGKRVPRPSGVKGHYRVVDPRAKKDKKNSKDRQKSTKKRKHHSRR